MNSSLKQWAARFDHAPKQNFTYLTVAAYLKQYPSTISYATLKRLAEQPDRLCQNCGQFYVWKLVMDKMPQNDMCFTCITGETDASEDYEIMP